jgi:hypothetical protein
MLESLCKVAAIVAGHILALNPEFTIHGPTPNAVAVSHCRPALNFPAAEMPSATSPHEDCVARNRAKPRDAVKAR